MRITPKTEEQIEKESKFAVWPAGKYNFEVATAVEGKSKNGADMITLTLNVFNDAGESIIVKDYLLEAMAFKLRHACDACGIIEHYENGNFVSFDFEGKRGELELKIEKGQPKQDGSGDLYADKNSVKDYVKNSATQNKGKEPAIEVKHNLDDEIPF